MEDQGLDQGFGDFIELFDLFNKGDLIIELIYSIKGILGIRQN